MQLPIIYDAANRTLVNATEEEIRPFYEYPDIIRRIERASIRLWMEQHKQYLTRRTLDFGSGLQPYRDLVTGAYVPFEINDEMYSIGGHNRFDTIICNQVVQYLPDPVSVLRRLYEALTENGHLLLTWPANWDVVEETDLNRYTVSGMKFLATCAGFTRHTCELRASVRVIGNFHFPLGYGMVAQK